MVLSIFWNSGVAIGDILLTNWFLRNNGNKMELFEGKTLLNKLCPLLDLRAELVLRLTKSFFD